MQKDRFKMIIFGSISPDIFSLDKNIANFSWKQIFTEYSFKPYKYTIRLDILEVLGHFIDRTLHKFKDISDMDISYR